MCLPARTFLCVSPWPSKPPGRNLKEGFRTVQCEVGGPAKKRNTASMSRVQAVASAERYFDEGRFFQDLARRVAIPTESQNPSRAGALAEYLEAELAQTLGRMGFECRIVHN